MAAPADRMKGWADRATGKPTPDPAPKKKATKGDTGR